LTLDVATSATSFCSSISAIEDCEPGDLVFADKKDYVDIIKARKPAIVVTTLKIKEALIADKTLTVLITPNVPLAHALLKKKFADRDYNKSGWSGVHPSAVIHESAELHASVIIEPKVVIGQNVKIGRNTRVMAGSVIENDSSIGEDTIIHPNVVVGHSSRIGSFVVIESGSVLGSEGYGFAQDAKRRSYPIPQTGIVVIEDRVRVGANNCIDRAAYKETRIGAGTKLDNLCHIAHNVVIGEDCLLTSMLCVAGSSKIGNRVITSGQTGVLDHVTICDDVVLLQRAGVNSDIKSPGAYAGAPLLPLSDYMKNAVVLRSAIELRKRIVELEKIVLPDKK
jgi:UDP-3-O-[3-hydroxymyristoyl] glucosamine N-acyltransferase